MRIAVIGAWVGAAAFLVGGVVAGAKAHEMYRRVRESADWRETSGIVLSSEIREVTSSGAGGRGSGMGERLGSGGEDRSTRHWNVELVFEYEVGGTTYRQKETAFLHPDEQKARSFLADHPAGSQFGPLYYDEDDPERYVRQRGGDPLGTALLHLGSLVVFGVGVLLFNMARLVGQPASPDADPSARAAAHERRLAWLKRGVVLGVASLATVELVAIGLYELLA